jgi:hypothetical protein
MSLFLCEQCGHIENTALSHYHLRGQYGHDGRALCSHCDPGMEGHSVFPSEPWDGEIVRNPELIPRFHSFRCYPDKCSHGALGNAGSAHLGAINVCKDCGTRAEIIDVGRERRELEQDARYLPQDYAWKILA